MEVTVRRHVKHPVSPFVGGSFWRLFKRRGNPHADVPSSSAFRLIRHDRVIKAASRHTQLPPLLVGSRQASEGRAKKGRSVSSLIRGAETTLNSIYNRTSE